MSSEIPVITNGWKVLADMIEDIESQTPTALAPVPDDTPVALRFGCVQAFARGKQAAKHSGITGPEIPESADDYQKLVLMTYYILGINSNSESKSFNQSEKSPRGKEPDEFDGNQTRYRAFVSQLALCFGANTSRFSNDKTKISYAASFLRGPAFEWLEPYINKLSGDVVFPSYAEFLDGLQAGFADPDAYATAERDLESLTQEKSCSAYYSQFIGLISQLGWNENAVKIHYFRQGLKDNIKDRLVGRDLPDTIEEFAALCIKLDNQIQARLHERKNPRLRNLGFRNPALSTVNSPRAQSTSKPTQIAPSQNASSSHNTQYGEPMELDAASRKAYRIANNLCTYCAADGHWIRDCPKAKARNARVAAATLDVNTAQRDDEILYETKNIQS